MQIFTPTSVSWVRVRVLSLVALLCAIAGSASAAGPSYSTTGVVSNFNAYRPEVTAVLIVLGTPTVVVITPSSGLEFPARAADANLQNFAILHSPANLLSRETVRLGLSGAGGAAGDRAGVLVSNVLTSKNVVNLDALAAMRLVTYNGTAVQESKTISAAVAKSLLESNGAPTQLEFVAKLAFTAIELQVDGAAKASYRLNVHYAYSVPSLVQKPTRGLISRFTGGDPTSKYDTSITPQGPITVCVNADVANPENTVDNDLDNYATFSSALSVSCPAAIKVKLEGAAPAPAGYLAGFVIGSAQLLDLSVLSGLRITTFLNGVKQETSLDPRLLEIKLLPDGKAQVSFPSSKEFNEVKIERVGLLTALDDLRVYYGFAVEPRAFAGNPQVLSDFPTSNPSQQYQTETNVGLLGVAGVCVDCGIANPEFATDASATNSATMSMGLLSVNSEMGLKMNLNGVGVVGNRAGVTLSNNGNLLDLEALSQVTVTTFDAAGNALESASGRSLLSINVLPGGKQEISFLTTRDFSAVKLTLSSGASALTNIRVFNAFADDRTGALPSIIAPLPVELSAFSGRWVSGAAELSWATATEKNSSHFVVERSTGKDAGFVAVGQVKSAGNSSRAQAYNLRDHDAAAQGVAMLYYRLRQVDKDGTEAFSPVVSVAVGKPNGVAAAKLEVYPNPTSDVSAVMVRFQNMPAGSTVQTYSQLGQLVSQTALTETATRLVLPASLAPGLYHVVLRGATGETISTQRLVVEGR